MMFSASELWLHTQATTPAARQLHPGDKAVSIRFSLLLDASGWKVFADADHSQLVPTGSSAEFEGFGLSQFGTYNRANSSEFQSGLCRCPRLKVLRLDKESNSAFPLIHHSHQHYTHL
jgi:hypothetical protein|eukprot:COSAG01_NODE_625_length_14726_cov_9.023997_17_plen_118_part_00